MKHRLLICGGTGFIGRNLVEHFSSGDQYEVFATHFTRQPYPIENVTWVKANLCDARDVAKTMEGMDIVIQAAATTSGSQDIVQRPYIHVADNAVMNSLILRASFDFNIKKLIFFSCTVMYPSSDRPLREDELSLDQELQKNYFGAGWTKLYIEKMCEFYSRLGRCVYTVLRHSNIYGPYDKYDLARSHVFGATVAKVMQASEEVTVWGTGQERRDLLYVEDLVDCVSLCLDRQNSPFALFNVGLGSAVSVKDLVLRIVKHSGKHLRIKHDTSRPSIPTSIQIDCSKIGQEINWAPMLDLDEGIKRTLNWYRENISEKRI